MSQIVDERLNDLQSSHSQPHPHVGSNQRHCSGEIISCQRCSLHWYSEFKNTVVRKVKVSIILINKVERDEGRVLEGLHGVEEDGVDVGEGAGWGALALLS